MQNHYEHCIYRYNFLKPDDVGNNFGKPEPDPVPNLDARARPEPVSSGPVPALGSVNLSLILHQLTHIK